MPVLERMMVAAHFRQRKRYVRSVVARTQMLIFYPSKLTFEYHGVYA